MTLTLVSALQIVVFSINISFVSLALVGVLWLKVMSSPI